MATRTKDDLARLDATTVRPLALETRCFAGDELLRATRLSSRDCARLTRAAFFLWLAFATASRLDALLRRFCATCLLPTLRLAVTAFFRSDAFAEADFDGATLPLAAWAAIGQTMAAASNEPSANCNTTGVLIAKSFIHRSNHRQRTGSSIWDVKKTSNINRLRRLVN